MTEKTLYHVTSWDRLPAIVEEGIVHQEATVHPGALGQDVRSIKKAIFAFENAEDAVAWAFRWTWDGNSRCAIIRFTSSSRWLLDRHLEAQMSRGRWLASKKPVTPEEIEVIVSFDVDKTRPGKDRGINYLDGPIKAWIEEGRTNGRGQEPG
jgi:hypothetical protein